MLGSVSDAAHPPSRGEIGEVARPLCAGSIAGDQPGAAGGRADHARQPHPTRASSSNTSAKATRSSPLPPSSAGIVMPSTPSSASAGNRSAGYSSAPMRGGGRHDLALHERPHGIPDGDVLWFEEAVLTSASIRQRRPIRAHDPATGGHVDLRLLAGEHLADELAGHRAGGVAEDVAGGEEQAGAHEVDDRVLVRREQEHPCPVDGDVAQAGKSSMIASEMSQPASVTSWVTPSGSPSDSRSASRRWRAATRVATSSYRPRSRTARGSRRCSTRGR